MDLETKRYRKLKKELVKQKPFRSKAALRSDRRRNTKIFNFKRAQTLKRSGLGAWDDKSLIDKYYVKEHFPPSDIMTELGGFSSTSTLAKVAVLAALGVLAFKALNM